MTQADRDELKRLAGSIWPIDRNLILGMLAENQRMRDLLQECRQHIGTWKDFGSDVLIMRKISDTLAGTETVNL